MPKIARELSALEVGRLKAPGLVSVGGVPGLALQIAPSGSRSWTLRVKIGDRRRDMGLGAYPGVTLAQAREKARQARATIDQGQDPILVRERAQSALLAEQRSVITFEAAARSFVESKSAEWSNSKHTTQWLSSLEAHAFPVLGPMHVADVAQTHVLQVLQPIWTSKSETASRVRGRIENILDWARVRGYRSGENPATWRGHLDKLLAAPKKVAKVKHHPAVSVDAVAAFYANLRQRDGLAARALEFVLLTAARSGEVRGACWSEIDLQKGLWTVPADRMKTRREHRVPLSVAAVELLEALPHVDGSALVFPSSRNTPLSDMTLTAVMRRMGRPEVPHGLRSTFRDWAAEKTSFPHEMVEMALAHSIDSKVEAAYRRGDMFDRRRELMDAWAGYLVTDNANANSNVYKLTKAAA